MPLFEALCHAFGTAGTGGFGVKNTSYIQYSPYLQNVTTVFMALFGVNFSIYYLLLLGQLKKPCGMRSCAPTCASSLPPSPSSP